MSRERFVLRLGALVVGPSEHLGWIDALAAIPGSGRISGVVLSDGPLFNRGVVVPIEAVERTSDSRIHIRLSVARLDRLAESQMRDTGPSGEEQPIAAGRRIVCQDGDVGPLVLMMVEAPGHRVSHFVIGRDDAPGRYTMVPISLVREITDDPIVLDASSGQLASLPEYRPDDEITDAVSSLLWYRSDIAPSDLRYVRIRTRDGVVQLGGKTGTERSRAAIEARIREVRGVLGVHDEMRTFEALAAAAQALRQQGAPTPRHGSERTVLVPLQPDGDGSAHDERARLANVVSESEPDASEATPLKIVA